MPDKISILKESGETLVSNVVSVFMIPDTEKKYIITTENAVDPHGLTVLHVSEIIDGSLQKIATDDEWSSIKTIMRAIISGNVGSYQYLPTVESIKASGQYSRDISVSASASKQMIDNYAVGEKSNVNILATPAPVSAPLVQEPIAAPVTPPLGVQPTSIFPTNVVVTNVDDELIPGISEIPNSMVDLNVITANNNPEPVVVPSINTMTSPTGVPVENVVPEVPVQAVVNPINTVPVSAEPVIPVVPTVTQVESPTLPVQPAVTIPDVSTITAPVLPDVQVASLEQTVPTAQIVQDAQPNTENDIKIDFNANPSFNPNATLDEVVAGAQEMFMEGVKNLVQTIQEKVYRDLYNKENELKNREVMLEQREKMINDQMMAMMSNFAALQSKVVPTPGATSVQPVVVDDNKVN